MPANSLNAGLPKPPGPGCHRIQPAARRRPVCPASSPSASTNSIAVSGCGQRSVNQRFLRDLYESSYSTYLPTKWQSSPQLWVAKPYERCRPTWITLVFGFDVQILQRQRVDILIGEDQRDFVDRGHVFGGNYSFVGDITKQRIFPLISLDRKRVGTAQQKCRAEFDAEQLFY